MSEPVRKIYLTRNQVALALASVIARRKALGDNHPQADQLEALEKKIRSQGKFPKIVQ